MKPFDYGKIMQEHGGIAVTRDGTKIKLLHQCAGNDVVIGVYTRGDGKENVFPWGPNGRYIGDRTEHNLDLFTPGKGIQIKRWGNVFLDKRRDEYWVSQHPDKTTADKYSKDRVACVEIVIDCEEGEGL